MRKTAYLSFLLLAACAGHGGAQAPASNDTLARIHALVGTPSCSEDNQCRSLPLGESLCGGPEAYLAYSTVRASEAEVEALGAIYQAERRKAQAGHVSACIVHADPGAICRAGTCVLRPGQSVVR